MELDPEQTPFDPAVRALIGAAQVSSELRPIVAMDGDDVIAYDLVARGAADGPFADPDAFVGSLAALGATAAIDEWRWREAVRRATRGDGEGLPIRVPFHPDSLRELEDSGDLEVTDWVVPFVDVPVTDFVYRAPDMIRATDRARRLGLPVMVSGIADERVLPSVRVLAPDLLSVSPRMFASDDPDLISWRAASVGAAMAPGALLTATGIDDDNARSRAAAFGVDLATGAAMGKAGRRGDVAAGPDSERTLFERLVGRNSPVRATKRELVELSIQLEHIMTADTDACVLVGAFQHVDNFTASTAARWEEVARSCAVAVAAGRGMPADPAPGVTGLDLDEDDRLLSEWHVAALSQHRAVLMCARDLGDTGPDAERRFDYVVSYDRLVVAEAVREVLGRIPGVVER